MKFLQYSLILLILQVLAVPVAEAGFGITPPYVHNSSLTRNSVYEQEILLVRSDPDTELQAEIRLDAPGFEDWIEIEQGFTFPLPAGATKVPMNVRVTVPDNAKFADYKGNIRIKTGPAPGADVSAGVSISLGAQVDIDLTVIDKEIFDFRVRKIDISELDEGRSVGWLFFPGKIRFGMFIENTGNVPVAPTEVKFRIFNTREDVLLEETIHTNRIKKVAPFEAANVVAELPTRLPAGTYRAQFEIKNGDEVKHDGLVTLNIRPYGSTNLAGYGFMGLSLAHKISVLFPIFSFIIIVVLVTQFVRSKRRKT